MKNISLIIICILLIIPLYAKDDAISNSVDLFSLSDVKITEGEMYKLQELSHKYLLTLEPDRLLSWFRREAGLTPKAPPYPLWESEDFMPIGPLPGHIMGFYLSGMAMMYQSTGDQDILDRLNYTVNGLREAQDANGDGYLLATRIGRHVFEDVVSGNFKTSNPVINDTWEPVYVMNKIMLGLYDAYTLCGIEEAKNAVIKMADWFGYNVLDKIDYETTQKMLYCEHGSINESFTDVYLLTNDKKYLKWAERLNDEDMWLPLSEGRNILEGWHANTQIPKFTGFLSVGKYNKNKALINATLNFWDIVTNKHTWVTGGNSCGEHFFAEKEYLNKVQSMGGPESCNSVNMMRLTEALYQFDGKQSRIDYYERVLLNHILGNFDPEVGMSCYYTSMRPGQYKIYADPYKCFWCCVGTGLQAPAKLAKMVYAHKQDTLLINMFIPTKLTWKDTGFSLEQKTKYPDENKSIITVTSPGNVKIAIRNPYWADNLKVRVKNVDEKKYKEEDKHDNGYIIIDRLWKKGDLIEITFSPKLDIQPLKQFDQYMSIQYGAYVMGTKVDNHGLTHDDFIRPDDHVHPTAYKTIPESEVPHLIGIQSDIKKSIKRVESDKLKLIYSSNNTTIELIPFTRILFDRYVVYFPRVNCLSDIHDYRPTKEQENYFSKTEIDRVIIGNEESEREHKIESYRSNTGLYLDQKWRDANNGGFFMYEMKCLPDQGMKLAIRYRQDDSGNRVFDIQVDGKTIKTTNHNQQAENVEQPLYYEEIYIPTACTKGKNSITIKFNAHNHSMAGGIFDLRILKQEN